MGLAFESTGQDVLKDDFVLVDRCCHGDKEAFDEIIKMYQKRVVNLAYHLLGSYNDALELAQDAFIKAYLSIKRFRRDCSFYTWLYSITVNLCKNKIKYQKRRFHFKHRSLDCPLEEGGDSLKMELPSSRPGPAENLVSRENMRMVREALECLDEDHRAVLILRDREMMSYEEISRITGCEVGTVKSRLHRGRTKLKEELKRMMNK